MSWLDNKDEDLITLIKYLNTVLSINHVNKSTLNIIRGYIESNRPWDMTLSNSQMNYRYSSTIKQWRKDMIRKEAMNVGK